MGQIGSRIDCGKMKREELVELIVNLNKRYFNYFYYYQSRVVIQIG